MASEGTAIGRKTRTFNKNSRLYHILQRTFKNLTVEGLEDLVRLPEGYDLHEWLASHVTEFYNLTLLIYGTVSEYVTEEAFPKMSAGPKYEYRWPVNGKAETVPACVYCENLFSWVEEKVYSWPEETKPDVPVEEQYPASFMKDVRDIMKRLFRVYAFMYYHLFQRHSELDNEKHLNTTFKHFMMFNKEFDLIPEAEAEPLKDLLVRLDLA